MFSKKGVHISAAKGIGMSALSKILKSQGFEVTESDKKTNNDHSLPPDTQVLIRSSALKDNHPQIIEAKQKDIPIFHRMDVISWLAKNKKVISIIGSSGKTSTTAMLANIFDDQSFILGGVHKNFNTNAKFDDNSEYLILELDESNKEFEKIKTQYSILTPLDPDHLESYNNDFSQLTSAIHAYLDQADFVIDQNYSARIVGNLVDVSVGDKTILAVEVNGVFGKCFMENAVRVIALCMKMEVSEEKIRKGLKEFKGVERRACVLGEKSGVIYIDDYAHTTTKIKGILAAVRENFVNQKITLLCEPHKYSRINEMFDDFVDVLGAADKVYLLPTYHCFQKPQPDWRINLPFQAWNNQKIEKGVLLCVGAGDSSQIIQKLWADQV